MPQLGVSVAEATVIAWHRHPGETVAADEVIAEISCDKVDSELPAPAGGVLGEVLVSEGETVPVGAVLARIEAVAERERWHSPVVRKLAAASGIDPDTVDGTGSEGRVRRRDILARLAEAAPMHTESPYREQDTSAPGERLSPMRASIAEHMLRSQRTAAHVTTVIEVDFSRSQALREELGVSPLPIVAAATVRALAAVPALNATLEGERLIRHEHVNLGIAVALGPDGGEGLVVPVIERAQELSIRGLAARIDELAVRARAGELRPDELHGGTFTITNPGRYGTIAATPIINQPQVAILDLEAVVRRPVVVDDAIAIRPMVNLCLSFDHRALDGVTAARFLAALRGELEHKEVPSWR
ncbi:MAG TPA: dihydrolipoamide acetyltransferase family protein [Solirubrobacteraceae bacterium]|jgi:pyruvate/2-oxoglutarate dehydrogenase complex dihydrolipoamide acyltransferase (E2) component|nr:dihydrolipoamide acetyltransferase family protein [Solirubrobacteraceae bacterium]